MALPNWRIEKVVIALTVDTNAYSANDVMGGRITIPLSGVSGGGFINRVALIDNDNEKAAVKIFFFDQAPTVIADDAAFAPAQAEAQYQIGYVALPAANYTSYSTNDYAIGRVSGKDAITSEFISWENAPSGNIYAYLVCDATPTYTAAGDLTLIVEMYLY